MWFTESTDLGRTARITPGGTITEYTTGLTANSDPSSTVAGADGNLWFTEQADPGRIGRPTPTQPSTPLGPLGPPATTPLVPAATTPLVPAATTPLVPAATTTPPAQAQLGVTAVTGSVSGTVLVGVTEIRLVASSRQTVPGRPAARTAARRGPVHLWAKDRRSGYRTRGRHSVGTGRTAK